MKSPGVFPEKATFLPDSAAALYCTCRSEDVKQSGWECSYLSGNTVRTLGIAAITSFFFLSQWRNTSKEEMTCTRFILHFV